MEAKKLADEAVRDESSRISCNCHILIGIGGPNLVFGRAQLEKGYRGSLEHSIVKDLKKRRAKFEYETLKIRWEEIMYRSPLFHFETE